METRENMLQTDNLAVGYTGKNDRSGVICDKINVTAKRGELVALFGANGIGKSTLLRSLVRLQPPLSGDIFLNDCNIQKYTREELSRMIGYVSTENVRINNMRVSELVSLGRFPYTNWTGRLAKDDILKVEEALNMVGMKNLHNSFINRLSDGERQRAMIARTLAQDTRMIILDEPTAFLDLPNKYEIVHLLHKLTIEKSKTIIFSTHDLNIAIQEANKIWLMLKGNIYQGSPEDLILEGLFGKMFDDTNLRFSTGNGEFRIERKLRDHISVTGSGKEYKWTKNALERMGYSVLAGEHGQSSLNILKEGNDVTWEMVSGRKTINFSKLYDLCNYLSSFRSKIL